MNKFDLLRELQARGANMTYFAIGSLPPGAYDKHVLVQSEQGWETYYTERGDKQHHRAFGTEEEACAHFLEWVSAMPDLFV